MLSKALIKRSFVSVRPILCPNLLSTASLLAVAPTLEDQESPTTMSLLFLETESVLY